MPTYEYRCKKCEHKFEAFHSMSAPPIKDCPSCKKKGAVERLISGGAGFIFKGSGFYITDYRSESYKQAAKADQAASSGSSSNGSSAGSTPAAPASATPAPAAASNSAAKK